tara:strand:- start:2812 stop:3678 length:867 start_codon:yes stop_codon:yes gene_type:complete
MEQTLNTSKNIGIVGLGLIGGSLGLDLQNLGYKVYGVTHRLKTVQRAKERGLAQIISTNPKILSQCSIVILALPLKELLNPDPKLISELPVNAVITDVGSVKSPVLKLWKDLHPHFVASHPMAGTNKEGVEAGTNNLFKGKAWISTPDSTTNLEALETIKQLAISLGSNWITAKPTIHDEAVALISHLPVLISAALLKTIESEQDQSVLTLAKALASSGFADTTRIGAGNPQLGTSMMENNTSAILHFLLAYKDSLKQLEEKIISHDWKRFKEDLEKTKIIRPEFLNE